jgi:hypothetical protein
MVSTSTCVTSARPGALASRQSEASYRLSMMSCCRLSCVRMFTSSNCILVEHLVRHPSRPRGKHTKADAGEDKHVITLPDGEGLPVVRYISNLSGKTSALSQCASRYDSGASLYIRFGGGSVLAVVSSSQLQYIRGADGEHV